MKIAGIIAEYNPLHNGHVYHLQQTRKCTGCDAVIVVMSGSYTQRGEAACLSKWTRARLALQCGADAVFELPALFAVRTADAFALGGVALLDALGADLLSFGCETEDVVLLQKLADLRRQEPPALTEALRDNLDRGLSHARAWGVAAARLLGTTPELLHAPNTVLGSEYLNALTKLHSEITPIIIRRLGSYHDPSLSDHAFASASAIRAARSQDPRTVIGHVPPVTADALLADPGMHPPDDLILHTLRSMSESDIAALPDVTEGLEHRIKRLAAQAFSLEELLDRVKCKRYTHARIRRLTTHAMLNLTRAMTLAHPLPPYARLIGMRRDAGPLLKLLKDRSRLPIISDAMRLSQHPVFQLECRATDLRALQCNTPEARRAGAEFIEKFVAV